MMMSHFRTLLRSFLGLANFVFGSERIKVLVFIVFLDTWSSSASLQRLRMPSPPPSTENEGPDDFELLLERHRLIQQQLETLERQEKVALESDIDDSFIDIPVGNNEDAFAAGCEIDRDAFNVDSLDGRNIYSVDNYNERTSPNQTSDMIGDSDRGSSNSVEESAQEVAKTFSPFKIKPRYPPIPPLHERSRIDLQTRKGEECKEDPKIVNSQVELEQKNKAENYYGYKDNYLSAEKEGKPVPRFRRKRKKQTKRKKSNSKGGELWSQKQVPVTMKSSSLVDPHSELEARLLALASSGEISGKAERDREEPERCVAL